MRDIIALAESLEQQAAELRAKVEDDIVTDEYGELWPDAGYQVEHNTLLRVAAQIRELAEKNAGAAGDNTAYWMGVLLQQTARAYEGLPCDGDALLDAAQAFAGMHGMSLTLSFVEPDKEATDA